MSRLLSEFLERLAERFAALMAGVVSSRVEGLQAVAQAEQHSQLEDLARRYEAEGKHDIAATLRQRALSLGSSDLAAQAVDIMHHTAGEPAQLAAPSMPSLPALPENAAPEVKARKKPVKPASLPIDPPLPPRPPLTGEGS